MVVLISQSVDKSKHHIAYLKYIQFLLVNYTSIRVEQEKEKKRQFPSFHVVNGRAI